MEQQRIWKGTICTYIYTGASLLGVCGGGGVSHPLKIFKNRENSGKLRENSVTSGNICGC